MGVRAAEIAWNKAKQLYDSVKVRFGSGTETAKALDALKKSPDDADVQAVVCLHLKDAMSNDEEFAKQLADILKDASDADVDTVFETTIFGDVQKLVQMGNVYGDVSI